MLDAIFGLDPAFSLAGPPRGGSSGPDPTRLQTLVTQASAAPTTVLLTLATGQTGVRVLTGETPASEKYFDLYVSRNGAAAYKARLYRWQGRILTGAPGDTYAFGTLDGRTITCAGMTVPVALVAPAGVTAAANCDQALPGLWAPAAAHVTLPGLGSKFQINSDGTERWVFIAEKDPVTLAWTAPRWVVLPAAANVVVHCNFVEVALANEAGAALSVTAPAGSIVGGAKTVMSLPFPAFGGTSHVCTTGAQFVAAMAAAVAGDQIVVSGTFALTGEVTRASFVANEAAGKKGYEGILIRGATLGDRTSGILQSGGFGWTINMPGAGLQMVDYGYMRDLTFDFQAQLKQASHGGGKYRHQNIRATGGTGDLWDLNATNYPIVCDSLFCRFDTSGDDCINLSGNATYNAASRVRFFSCESVGAGNNAASQCLTSHVGLPFEVYGGTYSDANTNAIANDAESTPGYVFWATISAGARQAGIVNGIVLFGCKWTDGHSQTTIQSHFSRITTALSGSTAALFRNSLFLRQNIFDITVGRAVFNSVGAAVLEGNIGKGNEFIRLGSAAGVVASTLVQFNTLVGGNIGFSSQDVSNMPSVFKNNAAKTNTTSVTVVAGGAAAVTGNYNTLDPAISANYTVGANDITGADAALSALFIPTAAGNCDGNGDPAVVDYVGDADPYGLVHVFSTARVSRGSREVPGIYVGAALFPEYF